MAKQKNDLFAQQSAPGDEEPLPDARAINRALRAERQREKDRTAISKKGVGSLMSVLRESMRDKRAGDPHAQLNFLLSNAALIAATGKARKVSEKTRGDFGDTLHRSIDHLRELRAPIQNIGDLGRSHVIVLTRYWVSEGQTSATIQTKSSVFRRFLAQIGKAQAMPKGRPWRNILAENGLDFAELRRSKIAQEPKAWAAKGVDVLKKVAEIRDQHPVVGMALKMQYAFGLRVSESISISPVLADVGNKLHVHDGTKGGRPRWVDFEPDSAAAAFQRDVLEEAKLVAAHHRRKILAIPGKTKDQMRNHFYYICRKFGITKNDMDIVPHGLRHEFGNRRHKTVSDLPAPVLRAAPVQLYSLNAEAVSAAEADTSFQMGHSPWRKDVTGAYNSTVANMTRQADKQLKSCLALFEKSSAVATVFRDAGVLTAWLIGRVAYGMPVEEGDAIEMQVLVDQSLLAGATALTSELERIVGRPVAIVLSADAMKRPHDGVEVNIRAEPQ
jgi:site-specific recombinase XerD